MRLYINIFSLKVPTYGLMIVVGIILTNLIAIYLLRKEKQEVDDFITLEAYMVMGAFIGAKFLYMIISYRQIEWSRLIDLKYFNEIMQSGFVFYGGLIGALGVGILAGKLHKIPILIYLRKLAFLIPFLHAFGRVGCFFAGCCYGRPYTGFGAIIYPQGSLGLSGIPLFPVQLVEAIILLFISILILILQLKIKWKYTIESYLILYSIIRFILEYFRYDYVRGRLACFSTSQWLSIIIFLVTSIILLIEVKLCHE